MDMDEVLKEAMSGDRMMDPAMMAVRVVYVHAVAVCVSMVCLHTCVRQGDTCTRTKSMHHGAFRIISSAFVHSACMDVAMMVRC
jgi:hypothetical protein